MTNAFICPVALVSSQTISFTVYSATKMATFTRSVRAFSQVCFTKVQLDLSNAQTATTIRLKAGSNHLGEVPYKAIVTSTLTFDSTTSSRLGCYYVDPDFPDSGDYMPVPASGRLFHRQLHKRDVSGRDVPEVGLATCSPLCSGSSCR